MTPQERQLIDDLFDRLAKLENAPRDGEAMSAIMQGLRTAPNAVYALVQTALVQDEALRRANDRIQELEAGHAAAPGQSGGFLDSMREAVFGQNQARGSGSVPNVRAPDMGGRPTWNSGQVLQQTQPPGQYGQPGYGQPAPYGMVPYDPQAKSKIAAGLLGIFLGGFGVHRFYLGFTKIGIIQIVVTIFTCGIGSLWGFVEGILYLVGSNGYTTDATGRPLRD